MDSLAVAFPPRAAHKPFSSATTSQWRAECLRSLTWFPSRARWLTRCSADPGFIEINKYILPTPCQALYYTAITLLQTQFKMTLSTSFDTCRQQCWMLMPFDIICHKWSMSIFFCYITAKFQNRLNSLFFFCQKAPEGLSCPINWF